MSAVRRSAVLLVAVGALLTLIGCEGGDTAAQGKFQWQPLFGDFTNDTSAPVATVGDIVITQRMVELYIDELPPRLKTEFEGADGERLALKRMIDQVLMVQGAMEQKIYNDQDVARQLIAQRRNTLDYAMRNYGLLRGNGPTEEDLRAFFNDNKDNYRQQGLVLTRHVELLSKADADLAYERLMSGEYKNNFPHVVGEMSVNKDTKEKGGNTGWFAKGGFIPFIRNPESFANQVFDLEIGTHPPIQVGDRWHVVDVVKREYARPQTFTEAKNKLMQDMLPGWQDAIIKDYLLAARKKYPVEMMGAFAPGQGASAEDLFARAMALPDHQKKLEVLSMIYTDYPTSGKADDALFMSANVALEAWQDRAIARRYLDMLITEFPDSELIEDAKFLRKNLYNSKVMNPQSIEDLKQN
jgi:parvulin-like peptidyl-prolyl isomerase